MHNNIMNIWEKALELLKEETSLVAYSTYIEVLVPRQVDNNTICFLAPSSYHMEICKRKYSDLITNSIKIITKKNYIIEYEAKLSLTDDEEVETLPKNTQNKSKQIEQKNTNDKYTPNLNPKYTFENFIVGENNKFARAAALRVTETPGETYNPLYIYGGVGLGKTHLMQAIGNEISKNRPDLKIICTTGEIFSNELISTIMSNKNERFREKYRNTDILLIDDIQFLVGKEKCQEEFFHTFNALFESGKQIVITSEKPPKEILLADRLKTRFEMGLAVDIQTPDYETRLAILRKKMQLERYIIDDDVLVKIASKVKSNVRELEGVFNKLVAYSSFTNNDITDSVVENTIESILVKNSKVLTSKLIIQVVAKFFNIKVSDIMSSKRSNSIAYPRQIAMFLCRDFANLSFPVIGRDFGGRDHSTVLHSYGKIKELYDVPNSETRNVINEIKIKLNIVE